jgi:hypothetical protein
MNKFTFILASVFFSGLATGVLSAIFSGLYSFIRKNVEHPHQIVPNWMIFFVLGFAISACVTLLYSIYCVFYKGDMSFNLWATVRMMAAISLGIIGMIALSFSYQ